MLQLPRVCKCPTVIIHHLSCRPGSSLLSPCQLSLEALGLQSACPLALWLPPWQAPITFWPQKDAAASMMEVLNRIHTDIVSLSLQGDESPAGPIGQLPKKPYPTHLLTAQSCFTHKSKTLCVSEVWWNKVNHWALAQSAPTQWTLMSHLGSPVGFVLINWLKPSENFLLHHAITQRKICYYLDRHLNQQGDDFTHSFLKTNKPNRT